MKKVFVLGVLAGVVLVAGALLLLSTVAGTGQAAPPPSPTPGPNGSIACPMQGADAGTMQSYMQQMHGQAGLDAMKEHMDEVHGAGSFDRMMTDGTMPCTNGTTPNGGTTPGGMMGSGGMGGMMRGLRQ